MAQPRASAFGTMLTEMRRAASLTQEELADRAELSVRTVSDLERGVNKMPRLATARLLADALGLTGQARVRFLDIAHQSVESGIHKKVPGFPVPLTPIIGRDRELAEIYNRHADGQRFITLVGPAGVGKTRLALEAALMHQSRDGRAIAFVDLTPINDAGRVLPAIAQALGVPMGSRQSVRDQLIAALHARSLLMVLDNFEQVLSAATDLVQVLVACPHLQLLVTSRVALHVRGEHVLSVAAFPLPDLTHLPPIDALLEQPVIQMFVERAHAIQPDFQLTSVNAPAVAAICVRLDGLPLAIELVVTHLRLLPPQALLAQMAHRLPFLADGPHDLPPHQQTMRQAIVWSYDRIPEAEQALFRRLAVFAGGWTPAAVQALSPDDAAVPRLIAALVEHHLVQPHSVATEAWSDVLEPRFTLLEVMREFALEQLIAHGEEDNTRLQHAYYYADFAERIAPHPQHGGAPSQFRVLDHEHNNIRTTLGWLLDDQRVERCAERRLLALRLVSAMWGYWFIRGYLREGRRWLASALAESSASMSVQASKALRAKALNGLGWLADRQGDAVDAQTAYEESCELFQELNDTESVAGVLHNLGVLQLQHGRYHQAMPLLQRSLALQQQSTNDMRRVASLVALARLAFYQGADEEALALLREAEGLAHQPANSPLHAVIAQLHSELALAQGVFADATTYCCASLKLAKALAYNEGVAHSLVTLGVIAWRQGNSAKAQEYYEQSLEIARVQGDSRGTAVALLRLGELVLDRAEIQRARALAVESRAAFAIFDDPRGTAHCDQLLARAAWQAGNMAESVELWMQSLHACWQLGDRRSVVTCVQGLADIRRAQGEIAVAMWLEGATTELGIGTASGVSAEKPITLDQLLRHWSATDGDPYRSE